MLQPALQIPSGFFVGLLVTVLQTAVPGPDEGARYWGLEEGLLSVRLEEQSESGWNGSP